MPQHQLGPFPGSDPGPSTHPRGPPNLNQIPVVPPPQGLPQNPVQGGQRRLRTPQAHRTPGSDESPGDVGDGAGVDGDGMGPPSPHDTVPGGRTRGGRAAGMSNDEWARQRKDNHVSPGDSSSLRDCPPCSWNFLPSISLSPATGPFCPQRRSFLCCSGSIVTIDDALWRHDYRFIPFPTLIRTCGVTDSRFLSTSTERSRTSKTR